MASSPEPPFFRQFRTAVIVTLVVAVIVLVVLLLSVHFSWLSNPFTSQGTPGGTTPLGLPPASSLSHEPSGWVGDRNITPWQVNGHPVLFFEGATWCPYCAASSWVIYKVLASFGGLSGVPLGYSQEEEIPEVVLAGIGVSHGPISFLVAEDTSGITGQFPTITDSTGQAYIAAYAGSAIPFVVVNGQYVHGSGVGSGSLVNPGALSGFTAAVMMASVLTENGTTWTLISSQTYLLLAFVVESLGVSVASLAAEYGWSANLTSGVESAVISL